MGELEGIQLQPRDIAFLRGLFESRVMTLSHAASLHFSGKREMAKKRVQKLKAAGLIRERPRNVSEPSVIYLARAGLDILHEHGHLKDFPQFSLPMLEKRARVSDITLRHELEVMDVKAVIITAIMSTPSFSITEFSTWPALNQFHAWRSDGKQVVVKPDGFLRIREDAHDGAYEHAFFLEIDRGTEVQEVLIMRAECYRDYYRRGGFAERRGGQRQAFAEYPFRVLYVLPSIERRDNTAARLCALPVPILTQVWLTTMHDLLGGALTSIWIRPGDYRPNIPHDGRTDPISPQVATSKYALLG